MINPSDFLSGLKKAGIKFVTGVPDSLLKDVCECITSTFNSKNHIIASNEGSAVSLAIGHFLATGRTALVYMQNSGLGNILNPIVSLADPQVYGIPMVLLIGWRGEISDHSIQIQDEPQHSKQGQITLSLLNLLDIPYEIIDKNTQQIGELLKNASSKAISRSSPYALVVRKNSFLRFKNNKSEEVTTKISRESAIKIIISSLSNDTILVSTTGKASRELFEIRKQAKSGHERDFLTVGGMGHASQIAAGIAISKPQKKIVCLDGDGSLLMHSGALAINADCSNLIHILLNNHAHDSVGGQPTKGSVLNFDSIAKEFGYKYVDKAYSSSEIKDKLSTILKFNGSSFLEVVCKKGSRSDLGRPTIKPIENKINFMKFLETNS